MDRGAWQVIVHWVTKSVRLSDSHFQCILEGIFKDFPGGSIGKVSACNAGDPRLIPGYLSSIPGLGRSPKDGNGNPLQCSCLEYSMDRGYCPQGHKESNMTE